MELGNQPKHFDRTVLDSSLSVSAQTHSMDRGVLMILNPPKPEKSKNIFGFLYPFKTTIKPPPVSTISLVLDA
jgi:hypothetical protein